MVKKRKFKLDIVEIRQEPKIRNTGIQANEKQLSHAGWFDAELFSKIGFLVTPDTGAKKYSRKNSFGDQAI